MSDPVIQSILNMQNNMKLGDCANDLKRKKNSKTPSNTRTCHYFGIGRRTFIAGKLHYKAYKSNKHHIDYCTDSKNGSVASSYSGSNKSHFLSLLFCQGIEQLSGSF